MSSVISQGEHPFAVGILLQWFWSSVTLTGNETVMRYTDTATTFWSSVTLTEHETECEQAKMALQGATAVDGQAAS